MHFLGIKVTIGAQGGTENGMGISDSYKCSLLIQKVLLVHKLSYTISSVD